MSNGEHEIRTPKGLRIGNRSVVDGKNMLQIKRGGCEDYISAESLVECIKEKKKAEIEAKKAAIRAEDIAKGVFVPVSQLPTREPQKGVQTA